MLFDNNNYHNGIDYNLFKYIDNFQELEINDELYSPHEGFIRGNMFKNLYDNFKNYQPREIVPNNEKDVMLLNIMELDFAINDLNLYLDINENNEIYQKFKKYCEEYKYSVEIYENKYGPLNLIDSNYEKYKWDDAPWPWEGYNV